MKFTDKDKLEYNAGFLLRRSFKRSRKIMLDKISEYKLTPMQTSALHALVENGPTSQNKLGRYIGMEPGNMHGLVERLSKKILLPAVQMNSIQGITSWSLPNMAKKFQRPSSPFAFWPVKKYSHR